MTDQKYKLLCPFLSWPFLMVLRLGHTKKFHRHMRRDWRVWIPISCGRRLVPPMQCPRLVPPMSKNHGVSQMQRRPPWSPCRPPWYVPNVPSLANWTAWNCKFFYLHIYCILEFWISTLLETISWPLSLVSSSFEAEANLICSRSLKSSQGSERWLSDWPGD